MILQPITESEKVRKRESERAYSHFLTFTLSHFLVFSFSGFWFLASFAQNNDFTLSAYEDTLKKLAPEILNSKEDREKYNANEIFTETLEKALNAENSFEYPFDSLITIARLVAPDRSFRIFNWQLPLSDGTFEYFGFIQTYNKKSMTCKLYPLTDRSSQITTPEDKILDNDEWYGAHYYKIITTKRRKNIYYTLLGWDGNDRLTTRKIIDVLYFPRGGRPKFGTPVFDISASLNKSMEKTVKKRILFEYSGQVVMSLRYNEDKRMIVFDHLSPPDPSLTGQYRYYGPDGRYDALKLKKGRWLLVEDVDARNERERIKRKFKTTEPGLLPADKGK